MELTLFNWKSVVDSRKNQTRALGIHPDERQPHKIGANNPQTYPGSSYFSVGKPSQFQDLDF